MNCNIKKYYCLKDYENLSKICRQIDNKRGGYNNYLYNNNKNNNIFLTKDNKIKLTKEGKTLLFDCNKKKISNNANEETNKMCKSCGYLPPKNDDKKFNEIIDNKLDKKVKDEDEEKCGDKEFKLIKEEFNQQVNEQQECSLFEYLIKNIGIEILIACCILIIFIYLHYNTK